MIFGQNANDLRKCHLLTVQRDAYKALATERARVNAIFAEVLLDQAAMNAVPINGVPQQPLECAIQMSEVDKIQGSTTKAGHDS